MLTFGDCAVSLIHLRGHTPGSLAVLYDAGGRLSDAPHVFTGDSLFPGGVGKTDSAADFTSLLTDVTERLFGPLPDPTWVYPGHGKDTTLGAERPHLERVARPRLVRTVSLAASAGRGGAAWVSRDRWRGPRRPAGGRGLAPRRVP